MKLFVRVGVIGTSVLGFTVAVALLVFNNQFFDFLGVTISENYVLNQIKADILLSKIQLGGKEDINSLTKNQKIKSCEIITNCFR